jgi:hypothetical protein
MKNQEVLPKKDKSLQSQTIVSLRVIALLIANALSLQR